MITYNPTDWYWIVGGDEAQVYASARSRLMPVADATYVAWLAGGRAPTRIASQDELAAVLRAANVPPFHQVSTYRVLRRLEDASLADAAETALDRKRTLSRRFFTAATIAADDQNARAFLTGIGADPDTILAPE